MKFQSYNLLLPSNDGSPNQFVRDNSCPRYLFNAGENQYFSQIQGELQYNKRRRRNDSYVNVPTGNGILTNLAQQTALKPENQISSHMSDTRYHQAVDTSLKEEFVNQKMLFNQLENLMHHEMGDAQLNCEVSYPPSFANRSGAMPFMGMSSPGFCLFDSPQPTLDNVKAASSGYEPLRSSGINDSHNFIGPRQDANATAYHASVAYNACSDVDWQSEKEPMLSDNDLHYLLEVSPEYYMGESNFVKDGLFGNNVHGHDAGGYSNVSISRQNLGKPTVHKVSPSVIVDRPSSRGDLLHSQLPVSGPQLSNHQPHLKQFGGLPVVPSHIWLVGSGGCDNEMSGHQSLKPHQLPLEIAHGIQPQKSFKGQYASEGSGVRVSSDGDRNLIDSYRLSAYDILLQYVSYKNAPANGGKSQVTFLNMLHWIRCAGNICECKLYRLLITHFDSCDDSSCGLCSPVLKGYSVHSCSASKRSKSSFSGTLCNGDAMCLYSCVDGNDLPHPKRMRVDNVCLPDNRPLDNVCLPDNRPLDNACLYSCVDGNDLPHPKRMRVDNACLPDNRPLDNVCLPDNRPLTALEPVANKHNENDRYSNLEQCPEGPAQNKEETSKIYKKSSSSEDGSGAGLMKNDSLGSMVDQCSENERCCLPDNIPLTALEPVANKHNENDRDSNLKQCPEFPTQNKEETSMIYKKSSCSEDGSGAGVMKNDALGSVVDQCSENDRCSNIKQWLEGPVDNKEETLKMSEKFMSSEDSSRAGVTTNDATYSVLKSRFLEVENASTYDMKNDVNSKILSDKHTMGNADKTESKVTGYKPEQSANVSSQAGLKDPKQICVSLVDFLTADQLEKHICSLGQKINERNKDSTESTMVHPCGENTCQLCAKDRLVFSPSPIYCSCCGTRIKRNLIYYWTSDGMDGRLCFCRLCFQESRGGSISFQGVSFCKEDMQKVKNNEEKEESWVQCDKCERWQHQICGLYNAKKDLEGKAKYICPYCWLQAIKVGEHVPLPAPFGAKDLPHTKLSDHIEQRLFRRLKEERLERAISLGKNVDEVPGAADLVVRVVLSVNKQLKVKQQFLDIFHGANYPDEFPYRSKVILLFQKVEGVDVCLFGMYVQQFGSDCRPPNQRSVYISYLDSVKYFQPQIETVNGEALRTFVYHEILIGYLDYCKKQGFMTCYIWACPPLKGEDYILSCHPEGQKTPKSDKLRQWYKTVLRKAAKEDIVAECTNLYDKFFVTNAQCSSKVTAARLPYFDGDYWSGAAEDLIRQIGKGGGGSEKKAKRLMTKRTLKAMGHTALSAEAATDIFVMQKLGHAILPVKEDFMVVHLYFSCSSCHEIILSRNHWICGECKTFHICPRCVNVEKSSNEKVHVSKSGQQHKLAEIVVDNIPDDTDDKDVVLDNEIFGNRHSFLTFCQDNHYQFDTLRRAKHSSMMILYHLLKQTSLALVVMCTICQKGTIDDGWCCEICPEFNVCSSCYQSEGSHAHVHKLTQRSSMTKCGTKNEQLQKQKAAQEKEVLESVVHVFQCRSIEKNPCSYKKCFQLKKLFHHASQCDLRPGADCGLCRKVLAILRFHARNCQDLSCGVPRCMEIKKRIEMRSTLTDSRRRAAVEEILADKVASGC